MKFPYRENVLKTPESIRAVFFAFRHAFYLKPHFLHLFDGDFAIYFNFILKNILLPMLLQFSHFFLPLSLILLFKMAPEVQS